MSDRRVACLLAVTLAALASLPQILPIRQVVEHQDPLFSIWRIAWIGHALAEEPTRLLHGNTFFPHRYTLTYSDTVLLQAIAGTTLKVVGLSAPVAYNILIWLSFPLSALTMFLVAEKVSGSAWAAVPAALGYALSAYRFDHIMHLEQVWTQWLPLHVLLTIRAYERGTWASALALAASLLAQLMSGLYLFVFTITAVPVFALAAFGAERRIPWRAVGRITVVGLLVVAPVAAAYAYIYTLGLREVGARSLDEVRMYSANLGSFFASPERNFLLGWTEAQWGGPSEKQQFPGGVALVLAILALTRVRGSYRIALAALGTFALLMTLGANGPLYGIFYAGVPGYANLRVPTRFGAFLSLAVASLAACGLADLLRARTSARPPLRMLGALTLLVLVETATGTPYRQFVPEAPTLLDRYLRAIPDAIVMEFPMPPPGNLPYNDSKYQMRSIHHWRPLVNGYSGNYPPEYLRLLQRLSEEISGSPAWFDLIRGAGPTHLIVHKSLDEPAVTGALLYGLEQAADVEPVGEMACWPDSCVVYRLR